MKLNELITEGRFALTASLRATFGRVYVENRANGFRVTVEARQGDLESFKNAIKYSMERAGYHATDITVHDNYRATIRFL